MKNWLKIIFGKFSFERDTNLEKFLGDNLHFVVPELYQLYTGTQ